MTNQEAFDRVVNHLRQQKAKSLNPDTSCAYRSPEGHRCAVGVLITDEFYSAQLEGKSARSLQTVLRAALPGVSFSLLDALQFVHDQYPITSWNAAWQRIAQDYGLTMPLQPEPSPECTEVMAHVG